MPNWNQIQAECAYDAPTEHIACWFQPTPGMIAERRRRARQARAALHPASVPKRTRTLGAGLCIYFALALIGALGFAVAVGMDNGSIRRRVVAAVLFGLFGFCVAKLCRLWRKQC